MKKQVVEISCDVCGQPLDASPMASERSFSIDGVPYQIDLCTEHAEEFASAVAPFVANARRVSKPRTAKPAGSRSSAQALDLKSVRSWAAANGFAVSERGRLPGQIVAAYKDALGEDAFAAAPAPSRGRSRGGAAKRSGGRSRDRATASA